MTQNEPALAAVPAGTSREPTAPAPAVRNCTVPGRRMSDLAVPASAEGQDGDAPEVVGELLFATAEAYEGVQTLRARLSTLQAEPFDLAAAAAVVELLSSARWHRARSSWQVLQGAQVRRDREATTAAAAADVNAAAGEEGEEGIDGRVAVADAASLMRPNSLALDRAPTTVRQTLNDDGIALHGTQRVSDLLLELGTVYGWSGIRHAATGRGCVGGRVTGFGGQSC